MRLAKPSLKRVDQPRVQSMPPRLQVGQRLRALFQASRGSSRPPGRATPGRRRRTRTGGGKARTVLRLTGPPARPASTAVPQQLHRVAEAHALALHHPVDRPAADPAAEAVPQVLRRRHDQRGRVVLVERAAADQVLAWRVSSIPAASTSRARRPRPSAARSPPPGCAPCRAPLKTCQEE